MEKEIPENLVLSEWGEEGYAFTLWQKVADFCAKFFQTPNGKVEAYIDSLLQYSGWMAACHIGKASADKDWRNFSLRKVPKEAKDVLGATRHRIREVLEGFFVDAHDLFSVDGVVAERPDLPDKFDAFFSESLQEGMDEVIDVLLEAVRQIALKEVRVKDKVGLSDDAGLKEDSKVFDGLIDGAKKRVKFASLKGAFDFGKESIDLTEAMEREEGADVVSEFCNWVSAKVKFKSGYDEFVEEFLRRFVKDKVLANFMLENGEAAFAFGARRVTWYDQFKLSMDELYQLFTEIKRGETVLPEDVSRTQVEGILLKVFQALETCKFLSSPEELERQIGLRPVSESGGVIEVPGTFLPEGGK